MSFEKAYENFKIYASSRHKKQGFDTIRQNFELHILPYFKNKQLSELKKIDIINWQTKILQKNFSNNFNRSLYYNFSSFMQYCVYCSYLDNNLVLQVEKFKKKYEIKKHRVYTLFQFLKFRFCIKDNIIRNYFTFMYFYGTRPSESMALRFSDLEPRYKYIHINHSIHRHGKREIDTPKNQSSIRTLKLGFFIRFKIWQLKRFYSKKYGNGIDYFIFGGTSPLSPTTIDRRKKLACNKAHLFEITQHEFRHSYATRMIHKKVPIDKVSRDLGHSTVSMTVDVYLHPIKKNTRYF